MNDKKLMKLAQDISDYLNIPKYFVLNAERVLDLNKAVNAAQKLFADMKVTIKDDPLELGSLILCITGFDIVVRGSEEIKLFTDLISHADNFEIYPSSKHDITFSIMFNHALIRV